MKRVLLVIGIMLTCSFSGLMLAPDSSAQDFEVMWSMQLPRKTYFIGETVSLTVTAFASTDPDLRIPGEMALITIRNDSMAEVYSTWITTNANGSAPVNFDIPITATTGNYTIILDPLQGNTIDESIGVLYNEEMYWKKRVELLEDEINKQYEYINYLFVYNNWLTKKVKWVESNFTVMWLMVFLCLLVGLYCGMYLAVNTPSHVKGILGMPGRALRILGLATESPLLLQHEEVAQVSVPPDKMPPIFGHDFVCEVCKRRGLPTPRLTRTEFEEHILVHDKLAIRRDSIMAKFRAWKAKKAEEAKRPEPAPKPTHGTVEKYAEEESREQAILRLKLRLKYLKKQHAKGKISKPELLAELQKIRSEKDELTRPRKAGALKESPVSKPISVSKSLGEIPTSGNLRVRRQKLDFVMPISEPNKVFAENPPTDIDKLFDKLNNQKVK